MMWCNTYDFLKNNNCYSCLLIISELANSTFNRSLLQQSKQLSMRAYAIRLNCRWTLHVVPELPRNSRLVDNTFSPSRWRFRVQAQIVRLDSISTFNVHVAFLSDYDHHRGFQYLNINSSHVRNISILTLKSTFVSLSIAYHLIIWNYLLQPLKIVMHGFTVL